MARDDLKAEQNIKRIDDLESFRNEFEGKNFDKKVLDSLRDYSEIRNEVKKLVWETIKDKSILIFIGALSIIFISIFKDSLSRLFWFK